MFVLDCETSGNEPANAGDALLAIQNLETITDLVEVEQTQRVATKERIDDGDVALPVGIDVVTLVFGLDGESPESPNNPLPSSALYMKPSTIFFTVKSGFKVVCMIISF